MARMNAFYAQSGGVTAVINASAAGVIETAREHKDRIGKVYAGRDGILGALHENLIDTSKESRKTIEALCHTPGGVFGSCRHKLKGLDESRHEYERLIEVFRAHNIGYFFYNGGGDSADTCLKISQLSEKMGFPIQAIHVPKTVDNDLPKTDTCPGFGSVAKYTAVCTREAGLDVASMYSTSTRVFVMEVMGRHAGWIAASSALAAEDKDDPPHVILLPEVPLDQQAFLERVQKTVERIGYCVVVVSEGARYPDGTVIADAGTTDAFGHKQLGGVAPIIAQMVKDNLGYKYHWSVADYLQRSARHLVSATDLDQAYAVGRAAVEYALAGRNAVMPAIVRRNTKKYSWTLQQAPLNKVANVEKKMPKKFIAKDGLGITPSARQYLAPLIQGEAPPPYRNGLPQIARPRLVAVPKKLHTDFQF